VGVEVNELARSAAQRRGLVIVSSTHELEDGIADVVISNHALEHTWRHSMSSGAFTAY
jgi:hypothetical protein